LGVATALVAAGCGGGGGTASPHAARGCLERAGYAAVERPGSVLLHTTGEVDLTRGRFRAAVYFFDSEDAASRDAVALGGALARAGGGLTVQRGDVVVGYARRPSRADRDRVEGCLTS
jgi:hypothetical protein